MELIGGLGSPYTRRTAVSLALMGLEFKHRPISLLNNFEDFRAINPVAKAPTLITDDGVMMTESSLILDYAQSLPQARRQLTPAEPTLLARAHRITSLGLVAIEKSVQILYETRLRPEAARWPVILERASGQLAAACSALDQEIGVTEGWLLGPEPMQADVTAAIAWRISKSDQIREEDHPALAGHAARMEQLPEFIAYPSPG